MVLMKTNEHTSEMMIKILKIAGYEENGAMMYE